VLCLVMLGSVGATHDVSPGGFKLLRMVGLGDTVLRGLDVDRTCMLHACRMMELFGVTMALTEDVTEC
jgi:hypothetical protein